MKKWTCLKTNAYRTPAAPAAAPPMAKVITMIRSTLIPMRAATSMSSDTDRIAVPVLVRITNVYRAAMRSTEATITTACVRRMAIPSTAHFPLKISNSG
jgi:hypothetical protein